MTIKTVFNHGGRWEKGEVEIQLLPGIPNLHVVGLPDPQIREAGIKLKSALKACGFSWPRGHQIIVNLRPNHFRKSSPGVELAIALGFLALSQQLPKAVEECALNSYVYGEVALDGRVIAPHDLPMALRGARGPVLTGVVSESLREGEWAELETLKASEPARKARFFDWDAYWRKPVAQDFQLHPEAARALLLTAHMGLNVLVAGPQGSGKTTWARLLHALSEPPQTDLFLEREEWVGFEEDLRWRPFEQPHHSITPLAMVGGSYPIQPGVVTRAHGGMLVMDEFLEFHPQVLESLREPLESGLVEIARKGSRERIPARFQLIGTTNLCPCGKLYPGRNDRCPRPLNTCNSVLYRLSGPMLDRFDMLLLSHRWNDRAERVRFEDVEVKLASLREFRKRRGKVVVELPDWVDELRLTFRRQNSMLRVARGLADLEESSVVSSRHFHEAHGLVISPIDDLNRIFA